MKLLNKKQASRELSRFTGEKVRTISRTMKKSAIADKLKEFGVDVIIKYPSVKKIKHK